MPFICSDATAQQLVIWYAAFLRLPSTSPLKQEAKGEDITLYKNDGVVVFQTKSGFYFRRGSLEEAVETEFDETERRYLCTTFQIDTRPETLLQRFQEVYGHKARQIDTHVFEKGGKTLLLALLPSSIVREMMCESGGILKTVFKGNTRDLKQIRALAQFIQFPDEDMDVASVFATRYEEGQYDIVKSVHYQIVKEVVEKKRDEGGPITLGPIAQWDA